ncbi:MAG: hypothetical protein GTN35_03525 [Nitrososphaeria archaeon]|nr:hypothetical protein [Nitrosopumilaceae archaeon]NIP09085.1 hypothetical protein [Nitrosopumilaceae archaeon]NIP91454.1 hypothetical protein [Nitrososphaeria archaeon]NIS95281.1 hypothetical protein [Nitrosopumilaceae archaeon]
MNKIVVFFVLIGIFSFSANFAYSQEIGLATFQETAQVLVDRSILQEITASITLQTTSIQEIKIPSELEKMIREDSRITSVILTNQEECILGVVNESCIMINVLRNPEDKGVIAIQDSTKEIGESYIHDINEAFDTDAKFHSVYIHTDDQFNRGLETSGMVSGRGVISSVYTMPMEDSGSMYEKISGLLIPKEIREAGGFYETAKNLSFEENSKVTFSIIPMENSSLMQLKVSANYPNSTLNISELSPLEFLHTDELKRSQYFSGGFYPLNSIFQILILSPESTSVSNVKGSFIPTQIVDGEKIPTELTKQGWVFDPEQGERIQGKYLFGEQSSVKANMLQFSIGEEKEPTVTETSFDESIIILIIIIIGGIAAAIFFLKGYRK